MIRSATSLDSEVIGKALWDLWHRMKARQIACPLHAYPSLELLVDGIRSEVSTSGSDRLWFICESVHGSYAGLFALLRMKTYGFIRRCRFADSSYIIERYECLLDGEVLLGQFKEIASHFPEAGLLVCVSSELRDAYWAALKAGFCLLGESTLVIGTEAWLYLDRGNRFDEVQMKLRRAKLI
jgi:hypothetical protein